MPGNPMCRDILEPMVPLRLQCNDGAIHTTEVQYWQGFWWLVVGKERQEFTWYRKNWYTRVVRRAIVRRVYVNIPGHSARAGTLGLALGCYMDNSTV